MKLEAGSLVQSMKGRDKGEYFFILREEEEYIYLVDGIYRCLDCPKKKKKKHVKVLIWEKLFPGAKIQRGEKVTDEEIKYFIKYFKREEQVVRR